MSLKLRRFGSGIVNNEICDISLVSGTDINVFYKCNKIELYICKTMLNCLKLNLQNTFVRYFNFSVKIKHILV